MGVRNPNPTLCFLLIPSLLFFLFEKSNGGTACNFPVLLSFGDDNSDTGANSAVISQIRPPYGATWPGKPAGRYSDGRLVIDFYAENLGLPYLSAYVDSINTTFRTGANFAAAGATIGVLNGKLYDMGGTILWLAVQLNQYKTFVNRTQDIYGVKGDKSGLPNPQDFPKALHFLECGQNDLLMLLIGGSPVKDIVGGIPVLMNMLEYHLEVMIQRYGAKYFWIHNIGPIGCLPISIEKSNKGEALDELGCLKSYNEIAQEFNKQLKDVLSKQRQKNKDATIVYVDAYTSKYDLFRDATKYGFKDSHGYCCKYPDDASKRSGYVRADEKGVRMYATCNNTRDYMFFDTIHYTEAANKLIANRLVDGSLSDPPIPLTGACNPPHPPKTEL